MPESKGILNKICLIIILLLTIIDIKSQVIKKDSSKLMNENIEKYNQFYDSLKARSRKKKFSSFLYRILISEPRPPIDRKVQSLEYFRAFKGKTINSIDITPLDVFGPTLEDTARKARSWV